MSTVQTNIFFFSVAETFQNLILMIKCYDLKKAKPVRVNVEFVWIDFEDDFKIKIFWHIYIYIELEQTN